MPPFTEWWHECMPGLWLQNSSSSFSSDSCLCTQQTKIPKLSYVSERFICPLKFFNLKLLIWRVDISTFENLNLEFWLQTLCFKNRSMWAVVIQHLPGPHPYLSHTLSSQPPQALPPLLPKGSGLMDTLKVFLLGVLAGGGACRQAGLWEICEWRKGSGM